MVEVNQRDYINKKLKLLSACEINDRIYSSSDISTPIVKDILTNRFDNGSDMNAIVCMFDDLFLSSAIGGVKKKDGLYELSTHVSKWVKKFEKINIKSSAGYVYLSDILGSNIEVIIKVSKNTDNNSYNDMIREYFIGVSEINKLRYILPNFVYTFGSFLCPSLGDIADNKLCEESSSQKTPFIIFEKVPGETMEKMLRDEKISFDQYLGLFIQILLALEIAQRNIGFCHFDFHTSNLMCRTIPKKCKYIVPVGNYIYDVTSYDYLPVIIDFGLSSIKNDDMVIGSYDFAVHGMMNYMIQGVDMYKFLIYSCYFSKGELNRQITNLLSFYGDDDPYKIIKNGKKNLVKATDKYVRLGSYSRVTTYTPIEFLEWIMQHSDYSNISSKYIRKKERNLYIPLSFSSTIEEYYNIFQHTKIGIDKSVDFIVKGADRKQYSFIMTSYSIYVLSGYNKNFKSDKINDVIKKLTKTISKNKNDMIKNDNIILNECKNIEIPDMISILDDSKRILNIRINSKRLSSQKKSVVKLIYRFMNKISFFSDILPYLQFLYTIRELKLDDTYNEFITNFSYLYKIYDNYNIVVSKTSKWCETLNMIKL